MLFTIVRYVVALTDSVISHVEARRERARARAVDTRRPHLWGEWYVMGTEACAYCNSEKTAANASALCDATGKASNK